MFDLQCHVLANTCCSIQFYFSQVPYPVSP